MLILKGFNINRIVINKFHYFKTHHLSRNTFLEFSNFSLEVLPLWSSD